MEYPKEVINKSIVIKLTGNFEACSKCSNTIIHDLRLLCDDAVLELRVGGDELVDSCLELLQLELVLDEDLVHHLCIMHKHV